MIPPYIQDELAKLSDAQKQKFQELLAWAGYSGLQGIGGIPVHTFDKLLDMVKQMGAEPVTVAEPDKTVNHDWNHVPIKRENR